MERRRSRLKGQKEHKEGWRTADKEVGYERRVVFGLQNWGRGGVGRQEGGRLKSKEPLEPL